MMKSYAHDPATSIRASALTLAEHCPGSWRLRATVGEPAPTVEMQIGTELHAELAAEKPTPRAAAFLDDTARALGAVEGPDARRCEVSGTLAIGCGLQITGTVDALLRDSRDGSPIVVDYKTGAGFHLPPIRDDLQMLTYSAMHGYARTVRISMGIEDGALVAMRHDELEPSDYLGAFDRLRAAAREALAPRAPLLPGRHCSTCRVRDACPAQQILSYGATTVERIATPGDARRVAFGLAPTERRVKRMRAELQAWVTEHGPVRDGLLAEWGPHASKVDRFDDAGAVFAFVSERVGREAALASISITGASLKRGLSASLLDAAAIARVRGELREAGLSTETTEEKWGWRALKDGAAGEDKEQP